MKKFLILSAIFCCLGAGFPVDYPEYTKTMTRQEFYNWATRQNKQAEEAWFSNNELEYIDYSKEITTIDGNTPSLISVNSKKTDKSVITKHTLPYRYKNPDYKWPGPLTIINPYIKPSSLK
jgi:hypothetical protein